MNILRSFYVALSMYSRIPVPRVAWTEDSMKYAMCFFPVIGVVQGVLFAGLWILLVHSGFGVCFRSALLTALPVLVTGGIHMDGFLDTVDALSSWQTKERRLEILKDSHTGAFAIIGGGLYFLLYAGGVSEIQSMRAAVMTGCGFVLSRILSAGALVLLKGAKKEGLAYTFMSGAHRNRTRMALAAELAAVLLVMAELWLTGAVVMVVLAAGTWLYYRGMAYRQFGGITGDLAGFFLQICELLLLYGIVIADRFF